MPTLIAKPHYFKNELYKVNLNDGDKLADILDGFDLDSLYIEYNGKEVSRFEIPFIILKNDDVVVLLNIPKDDAGNVLKTVAIAVVAAVAFAVGGNVIAPAIFSGASLASTGTAYYLAVGTAAITSAVATIAGSMLLNAIIPPPELDSNPNRADYVSPQVKPSITGTSNQYAIWKPIPRLYGTYRYYPPLAARYFTEISGNDQYLRMLLCLGYGPLQIGGLVASSTNTLTETSAFTDTSAIKIGDTSIFDYEDVEFEIGTIPNITLFTSNIVEDNPSSVLQNDGDSATRATDINTKEITIDFTFTNGLFSQSRQADIGTTTVNVTVSITDYTTGVEVYTETFDISANSKETYRFTKRIKLGGAGQYNVTVTRNSTTKQYTFFSNDTFVWSALRSIKSDSPPVIDNGKEIIFMALRIKATDQLNGIIKNLSVEATSILPVYDSTTQTWSNQPTSNPAWIYYHQLTGEQTKNPISADKIALDDIVEWATLCDNFGPYGKREFNYIFDSEQTQYDRLQSIARVGFATFTCRDGYFSVVIDNDTSTNPPVQVISPRNARNFSAHKVFKSLPDAVRVRYVDKLSDYEEDEVIVYNPNNTTQTTEKVETIRTLGITSQSQAYMEGTFYFRQAILRPEIYSVEMDYENLVFTRGDVVLLAYDVIDVGIKWGRIKSFVTDATTGYITQITLDEECPVDISQSYGLQIRKSDGSITTVGIVNPDTSGNYTTFDLTTGIGGVNVGDLALFGIAGEESIRCKVLNITYDSDLSAHIDLIDEGKDIWNLIDTPIYNPHITLPLYYDNVKPPTPSITAISGENTAYQAEDGSFLPSVIVSWIVPSTSRVPIKEIELKYRIVGTNTWKYIKEAYSNGTTRIKDVKEGIDLEIYGRTISAYGMESDWSPLVTHTINSLNSYIEDVTNFSAEWHPKESTILFTWDSIDDINLGYYQIREGTDWDTATVIVSKTTNNSITYLVPNPDGLSHTYLIKAISRISVESANASSYTLVLDQYVPDAPISLTTESLNYAIKVTISYTKPIYFDKLEIWASDYNDRSTATLVASIEDNEYILSGLDLVTTKYFWCRIRNLFGVYSDWYPADQYGGIIGTTDSSPDKLLPLLTGSITESELYKDLADKINWLSSDAFILETDIVESGILGGLDKLAIDTGNDTYVLKIDMTNVQSTLAEHLSQIQSLQTDIASLTTTEWDPNIEFTLGRIVTYNGDTWRCIQTNTGIAPDSPDNIDVNGNYVYWEPTDALSTIVADIDSRVDTLENEITTKVSQTDFDGLSNTVATHDTLIQQNADAITLKADKTEVSALSSLLIKDFDSSLTYSKWDLVKYDGNVYQCIIEINFTPAPLPTDTTYWELVAHLSDVISHNYSEIEVNKDSINLISSTITGDIALEEDIVEDGIVVFDVGDIYNLDNRISSNYFKISNAEIKIDTLNQTISEQISTIENDIQSHELRISTAEQNISTLTTTTNVLQSEIETKVGIITYNTDVTNDLKPRMATAEENISVLQNDIGEVKSEWTVKLNADGHVAGIGLIASSDAPSEMIVVTDKFSIVNPNDSTDIKVPFVVGTINGTSTVGISGDLIVDGSISANALSVTQLSAISADLGNITAGTITMPTTGWIKGGQTEFNTGDGFFLGYDTDAYKFSVGAPENKKYIAFDGTDLKIGSDVTVDALDSFNSEVTYIKTDFENVDELKIDSTNSTYFYIDFDKSLHSRVIIVKNYEDGHITVQRAFRANTFHTSWDYNRKAKWHVGALYRQCNTYIMTGSAGGFPFGLNYGIGFGFYVPSSTSAIYACIVHNGTGFIKNILPDTGGYVYNIMLQVEYLYDPQEAIFSVKYEGMSAPTSITIKPGDIDDNGATIVFPTIGFDYENANITSEITCTSVVDGTTVDEIYFSNFKFMYGY